MTLEEFKARLVTLQNEASTLEKNISAGETQLTQMKANLNGYQGAIQEKQRDIALMEEAEKRLAEMAKVAADRTEESQTAPEVANGT